MSAKSSFDFYSFAEGCHRYAAACTIPKNRKMRVRITFYPPKLTIPELIVDLAVGAKMRGPYYDHIINALKCAIIEKNEDTVSERFPGWPIFCKALMTYEVIECR